MARVLAISSQVARGHVGNSAAVFALQRLGHDVWSLPTVVLSNHPGHPHVAGARIDPKQLSEMVGALARNHWLSEVDAVLTGYLPSPQHVEVAADAIAAVKTAGGRPLVLVDPVLGDDPGGLYIAPEAALAVRQILMPLADILTPNRFELAWLTDLPVASTADAERAAAALGLPAVLATSIPASQGLANLLWQPTEVTVAAVPRLERVPHGTGDLLAALFLAHRLNGASAGLSMRRAVDGVTAAIEASAGTDELQLVASQARWAGAGAGASSSH